MLEEDAGEKISLQSLRTTGELFTHFPWSIDNSIALLTTVKATGYNFLLQRLGSCLSWSSLLCWPMLCLPLFSKIMMADPMSFMSVMISVKKREDIFWGEFCVRCYQNHLCVIFIVDYNVVGVN